MEPDVIEYWRDEVDRLKRAVDNPNVSFHQGAVLRRRLRDAEYNLFLARNQAVEATPWN